MLNETDQRIIDLQEDLKASEARFFNVVDISPDGVVVVDGAGDICFINDAAQTLFGRSLDQLLGKAFGFPLVSGEKTEIEVRNAKGKVRIVEMRVVKTFWEKKFAYLASLRDITEHNRLEKKLHSANEELVQFGYAVSHDIRAPLRNVHTLASWLVLDYADVFDKKVVTDLKLIEDNVNRTLRLVTGLLQFTQIGRSEQAYAVVDLSNIFREAMDNIDSDLIACDAEITIGKMPSVYANEIQLVSLFQNLISNCVKYCETRCPIINITAREYDDQWEISIADNGIGIEKQYWEKIFEPFERLHTAKEYEGSGIGLASCKKIVEQHNGRIWVESELDKGSTFFVLLPAAEA